MIEVGARVHSVLMITPVMLTKTGKERETPRTIESSTTMIITAKTIGKMTIGSGITTTMATITVMTIKIIPIKVITIITGRCFGFTFLHFGLNCGSLNIPKTSRSTLLKRYF